MSIIKDLADHGKLIPSKSNYSQQKAMGLFILLIAFVGCRAGPPTSSEEALKPVTQEFPCEAAILDTVVKAVFITESGNLRLLDYINSEYGTFFNYEGHGDHYTPPVVVYTDTEVRNPQDRSERVWIFDPEELFHEPLCNTTLETIVFREVESSRYKVERYACAVKEISALMDELWIGTDCGEQCWNDLESRLKRAYERYEYYKEDLAYVEHVQSVYFGEDAGCG